MSSKPASAGVIRVSEEALKNTVSDIFTTDPSLLTLEESDCGYFCCPSVKDRWTELSNLQSTIFLLDWTYPQAVKWFKSQSA